VELHGHLLNEVLQLEGVVFSVLFALQHVDLELAGLFDPVDRIVLPFSFIMRNLGVDGPFHSEAQHSDEEDQDEEPDETVEDRSELEEETVYEDGLAVVSDLGIHEDHLDRQACHAKTVKYVRVQTSVRPQCQDVQCEQNDHHHVCRGLSFLEFHRRLH
jgi:hypothetical protein